MTEQTKPCIVISQPMYFPWVGMLEQIRLCDTYVFYDDVQYARGFFNRVEFKTSAGIRWITVPLKNLHRGQLINEVRIDDSQDWRKNQTDLLRRAYKTAPYREEMLELIDKVFSRDYESLADLSRVSTMALIDYFDLGHNRSFYNSSALNTPGSGTRRLLDLCLLLHANSYLTGHGARHYLEHTLFETHNIHVNYANYGLKEYPQIYGIFTPYVSALDLVANCGKEGSKFITGDPMPWRDFMAKKNA